MDLSNVKKNLESLLFVAEEPVEVEQLARILDAKPELVRRALRELTEDYSDRGLRIQQHGDRVQFVTAPESAPLVQRLLGMGMISRLSTPSLEALTLIAYRQPVTRAEIEAIRGVDSDGPLRTLLGKGLIQELGRRETVGRPILYGTTPDFLRYFGFQSLHELPPVEAPEEEGAIVSHAGSDPD